MLSLAPPYYVYQGITVFADSEDPQQWYYLPNRPHFATDEANRPAVRFLVLKEDLDQLTPQEEDTAGFLVFDTSLSWPEAALAAVAEKIQHNGNLPSLPRMVPLLYTAGTVRLMFLDRTTPDPAPKSAAGSGDPGTTPDHGAPPAPAEQWVTMLECSGIPSMYGENRAIFSATLTKQATELLYAAFDGFIPAGVVYDLKFTGLQPAFHVHVEADWTQVFHSVKEKHSANLIFFSADIEKTVQSLIDNKTIVFTGTIEGVGAEGMASQFDEVRKMLMDFVLNTFFKPTPNPFVPDTSVKDGIIGVLTAARDLASPVNCGYQRIELDADELRKLSIDYDVAMAVERTIAPQSHLELFFADYNLTKEQVVTVVDGADAFFKEADFTVMTSADYATDGIEGVTVDVTYGQPSPPPANAPLWSWSFKDETVVAKKAAWFDPTVGDVAQYRYEVVFSPNKVPGPELKLNSDWQNSRGMVVMVTPEEMFLSRRIEFQLDALLPALVFPEVQVEIRYTEPSSGWTHEESSLLSTDTKTWSTSFRIHRDWSTTIEYRLTYIHPAGNMVIDWQPTDQNDIPVTDPRANLYPVQVVIAGDKSRLSQVVVNLSYADQANGIFESTVFNLDSTTFSAPHTWTFPRADPAANRYVYNLVIIGNDGSIIQTGDVQADNPVLVLGPATALSWTVQPEVIGPALADNGVVKIDLALDYRDDETGVSLSRTIDIGGTGAAASWPLHLADASRRQYTYTVTYQLDTGFQKVLGPLAASDTFLTLSSIPPA